MPKKKSTKRSKKKDPATEFFRTYTGKTSIDTWQNAAQHYNKYVGEDQLKWLDIAKGLRCPLPVKVGHGKGGHDDKQAHAQEYYKGYVEFVIQATGERKYKTRRKVDLKQILDIN